MAQPLTGGALTVLTVLTVLGEGGVTVLQVTRLDYKTSET